MPAELLFCPICSKDFRRDSKSSAEAKLAHHVITGHTPGQVERALHPCSGCSSDYTDVPLPYLALILQDVGPARWTEVYYCTSCVRSCMNGDNPDIVELIERRPIFLSER